MQSCHARAKKSLLTVPAPAGGSALLSAADPDGDLYARGDRAEQPEQQQDTYTNLATEDAIPGRPARSPAPDGDRAGVEEAPEEPARAGRGPCRQRRPPDRRMISEPENAGHPPDHASTSVGWSSSYDDPAAGHATPPTASAARRRGDGGSGNVHARSAASQATRRRNRYSISPVAPKRTPGLSTSSTSAIRRAFSSSKCFW